MSLIVADIEADGLYSEWETEAATRIDCLVMDVDGKILDFPDEISFRGELDNHSEDNFYIVEGDVIVFHNGIDYDLPMLKKFWRAGYTIGPDNWCGVPVKHVDTMLLSKTVNPDLKLPEGFAAQWKPSRLGERLPGPHSLEVWAFRLDLVKPKLVYGENMGNVPYAISVAQATADIEITKALYFHLMQEIIQRRINLRKPMAVENKVRFIISEGAQTGIPFDSKLAEVYLVDLDTKMLALAKMVEPHLPPRAIPAGKVKYPPKKPVNKDTTPSKNAVKYFGDKLTLFPDGQWYVKYFADKGDCVLLKDAKDPIIATEPMKISDSKDVKIWLQNDYGWKPTLWNMKKEPDGKKVRTSPKFHEKGKLCPNLEVLGEDVEIIRNIVLYLSYRNRRSVIKSKDKNTGWLNHPRLAIDGRLPADADTIGANTFRFTHRVVTNVPRAEGTIYGAEMRSLFHAPEGYKLIGWDAAGLEDRVKAHYCYKMPGGKAYAEKLLDPEFSVHAENMAAWNLPKGKCKNGHYAMQYNCRPPKLAETLGVDQSLADEYYEAWWANNEPLAAFQDHAAVVWNQFDKKWVPTIDGRWVPCTMEYMIVSRLFQSAGVIAMKYAMVLWYNKIHRLGLDTQQVIHYHDEADCLVHPDYAEQVGEIGCWSIKRAGEILNFNVPLLSDYLIGDSWRDIH